MPIKARRSSSVGLAVALVACGALAAPTNDRQTSLRERQGELRNRIEALRRDLAGAEESRASAADRFKDTESAISDTNRRLHRLGEQRQQTEDEVRDLEVQSQRLQQQTSAQQARLSLLLHRRYTRGSTDALQVLLSGQDANQVAVDRHLMTTLARATAELITDLRRKDREKLRLAETARRKAEELQAIEERQQQARLALVDQQKQRQRLLTELSDRIRSQRRELGSLQKDERRLGNLIAGLAKIVRKPARIRPPSATGRASPPPSPQEAGAAAATQATGAFAALRGRLPLPIKGQVASRFGRPRPEGGTTWKGLYIRATEGTPVHAVAAGQVVFADWLRGFGNLLIIDHGDDFLSVYGHNQSLMREAGDQIRAGEVVATVGATGGGSESGLYFELRHQGQAFDPLPWVSRR